MAANITYRFSLTPTVPASTTVKSSPLTNEEVDGNFKSIVNDIASLRTGSGVSGTWSISISGNAATATSATTASTVTTIPTLSGDVTNTGNSVTVSNAAVFSKVLTGYVSGAGTVSATDTLLQALQKLNGNIQAASGSLAAYALLSGATFTGAVTIPTLTVSTAVTVPTLAVNNNSTNAASTAFVLGQAATAAPLAPASTAAVGTATRFAREDHVHSGVNPYFRAHQATSTITITTPGTLQTLLFNTTTFGTGYATGTGRYTPGVIGVYTLNAQVQITGTNLTAATIQVTKNGTATVVAAKTLTFAAATSVDLFISDLVQATATTDTFEIRVTATGTTPVVAIGTEKTFFSAALTSR